MLLALYLLANAPARSGYGYQYSSDYDSSSRSSVPTSTSILLSSRGFRSAGSGYDILTLISVASDLYGKLSYDDLDCQKKIICEFMDEPEMFGSGASKVKTSLLISCSSSSSPSSSKVKTGVQYAASWLAPLGFTIVDQISEAAMLDSQVEHTWR